jgi:hypothetical protein
MNPADQISHRQIEELIPYARNSRTHSDQQILQIAASIKEWGWTIPVLIDENNGIIAGHGRILAARKLGIETVPVITAEGWSEAKKRAYVIADNKLALNADWDNELLATEISDLKLENYNIDLLGFSDDELQAVMADQDKDIDIDEEEIYTKKVDTPCYEPSENKPILRDLFDDSRTIELIDEIKESSLPQEEKDFLMLAAARHTRLNFQLIADYYSHASEECQQLMENNALVIIDFDKAIERGYIQMSEKISQQYVKEHEQ